MPLETITLSEDDRALLEQVRRQQGLDSIEQAAEWLAKTRLRRHARDITGRARALVLIEGRKQQ